MDIEIQNELTSAAQHLSVARRVCCLTGAGVSAESGVATFRDAQTGLWSNFDPTQLASQEGFTADPGLVWRWYMERLDKMSTVQPNQGHLALVQLASIVPSFVLATQNVDDLHERGGSERILHLHGAISRFRCNGCLIPYELSPLERSAEAPPVCPHCANLIRTDVVWFGEMLPGDVLAQAQRAARLCDVMLVVGTSGVVFPAAELPYIAQESGAIVVEVNPEATDITALADIVLRSPSGEALPALVARINDYAGQSAAGSQMN